MSKHDLRNYDKETINVFERIGAYFVGTFYNYLYETAMLEHAKGVEYKSVTDAYKRGCMLYLKSLDDPAHFSKYIWSLYAHFQVQIPHIGYTGFIDMISKELIPKEYWSNANSEKKNLIIGLGIQRAINNFAVNFTTPTMMGLVVDRKDPKAIIETLQNYMLEMFLDQRLQNFEAFAKSQTSAGLDGSKTAMASTAALQLKNKKLGEQLAQAIQYLNVERKKSAYLMTRLQAELKKHSALVPNTGRDPQTLVPVVPLGHARATDVPVLARRSRARAPSPVRESSPFVSEPVSSSLDSKRESEVERVAKLARSRKAARTSTEKDLNSLLDGIELDEETSFDI